MAYFSEWIKRPPRSYLIKSTNYGNNPVDPMNWTGGARGIGELVGTACDIGAPIWCNTNIWGGRCPTMQELSNYECEPEAKKIMKSQFWDVVRGDEIESQNIADLIADIKSHTGNVKTVQKGLNKIGEKLEIDGSTGPATLEAINRQGRKNEARTFNAIREEYRNFLIEISQPGSPNEIWRNGWLRQLDEHYPPMEAGSFSIGWDGLRIGGRFVPLSTAAAALLFVFLIIILFIYIKKARK